MEALQRRQLDSQRSGDLLREEATQAPARGVHASKKDAPPAEKLFAHKVLHLLRAKGLLSQERIELLTSFRNSGFSLDASPTVWPSDTQGIERLSRYLLQCAVSFSRSHWTPDAPTLFYEGKASQDEPFGNHPHGDTLDIFQFIARVLSQIPEPCPHGVHYFGFYSSQACALRKDDRPKLQPSSSNNGVNQPTSRSPQENNLPLSENDAQT